MGLFNTRPHGRQAVEASGMQNYQPASYRRARAALARVRANGGDAYFACVGDSNTRGTGTHRKGNKGADLANAMQGRSGYPAKLTAQFNAAGVKAQSDNFFGSGGVSANFATYDSRIVINGVTINDSGGGLQSAGGGMIAFTKAGDTLQFTVPNAATVADIFHLISSGSAGSTLRWSVDGGAATNFTTYTAGVNAIGRLNIPLGTLAAGRAILIEWVSGTSYLIGMDAWDNTQSCLHVWNMGWHGSRANMWAGSTGSSVWFPVNILPILKPDLIIGPILGTNDYATNNNVAPASFKASMQTLLGPWSAQSDILLLAPGPRGDATNPAQSVVDAYRQSFVELSGEGGFALVDEYAAVNGDFLAAQALGLYDTDNLHFTAIGAAARGRMLSRAVLAMT